MKNTFTIKLLFLIFPFMVQFAFGMQASGITENEPNNSIKEAEKISFPGAVYGTLEGVDDRDFYRLDIPSGGLDTLYFTLKIKGNCNPAVRLLNEKGETLTEADFFPVGSDEYLTSLDLKEGAYYVVVDRGRPKGKEEGSYVLTFDQVPEVNPANVKTALNRALDYIVSQQQEDGSFPGRRGDSGGIPSMAIQALMGADCVERNDWDAIYKGIDYLKSLYHDPSKIKSERGRQLHGGAIYRRDEMYDNGMALTTLIEAHVLGVEGLSPIIQGGLEYLMRSQLTDERPADLKGPIPRDSKYFGGWRYMAESVDADLSVTGWQIIALIAARKAGFKVPQKRLDYALEFVRRCYVEGKDTFAYMPKGQFGPPGRAGMGALSMQLLGSGSAPEVKKALKYMLTRAPSWLGEFDGNYPFYYWYYGTRAAFLDGGRTWDLWSRTTCGMLVDHQKNNGSWDLAFNELRNTNKVYVTALGALILEFCCGSVPIYMRTGEAPPRPPVPPRNEISVSITNLKSNTKLQGEIDIEALPIVPKNTTVRKVSFFIDGEKIGELEKAPWIWKTDLGPGVRKHVIKVTAENNFGKEAGAEVRTRAGINTVRVRIKSPRRMTVLGKQTVEVEASGHPESPLASVIVYVNGEEIFKGQEPPFRVDYDFGQIGGFEIKAVAVNVLGKEAKDKVVTREARPIEVDLTITVTDEANNYILDLDKEDFTIFEDGNPQEILQFSKELTPVSMALVLDTSGSMRRKVKSVHKAASQFVSQIKPVDRAMILEFSDRVRMTQALTSDIEALKQAIQESGAKGGTALYDAVIDAVRRLKRQKGRTSVILLTDGKDENNAGTAAGSSHSLEECIETAREAGVTIYALGLGAKVEKDVLTQIAIQTGGRVYFPPTVEDLAEVYGKIAKELRSQYTISYSSSNRIRDGAWRTIEIKVEGQNYIIRTKPGYYAPKH